jgi:hypothetical protein
MSDVLPPLVTVTNLPLNWDIRHFRKFVSDEMGEWVKVSRPKSERLRQTAVIRFKSEKSVQLLLKKKIVFQDHSLIFFYKSNKNKLKNFVHKNRYMSNRIWKRSFLFCIDRSDFEVIQ